MKTITVIGAGNCSYAMAADLSLKGHRVNMLVDKAHWDEIEPAAEKQAIELYENGERRRAELEKITNDPQTALAESEVVIIPVPAYGQEEIAEWVCTYLSEGQIVLLAPGNLGSLAFREILKKRGITVKLYLAETNETPYIARKAGGNKVQITGRITDLIASALPASDTQKIIDCCQELFPLAAARHVLHSSLHGTNPCYHVPGCVLNAGRIERAKGDFYLYEEGITPAVGEVMEQLDQERALILKKLGCNYDTVAEELAGERSPRSIWEEINGCKSLKFVRGPEDLQSRYLTEDIPYGLLPWLQIGTALGLELPVMKALVALGGIIIGTEQMEKGRTLEKMGLKHVTEEQLKSRL